jgi:hypothetical protein
MLLRRLGIPLKQSYAISVPRDNLQNCPIVASAFLPMSVHFLPIREQSPGNETLYTYESLKATTQYSRVDKQSHNASPKLFLHLRDCKFHTKQSYTTLMFGLHSSNCNKLITNQASSQIRRLHTVSGTNMMSNSNKFNVPDNIKMNTVSNNSVVDWCTTLNYSSMQIQ